MPNIKSMAIMAAAATFLPSALAKFDAASNSNMAVYWGQGPNQKPLSHYCADDNIDIINIGFLNQFPDQTGGYPGSNFGNQCGNETYKNPDGSKSQLLSNCPSIGPDIVTCQHAGKKVLLSLGGAIPSNQHINNDASANSFADFLWNSFGPKSNPSAPRPFGDAVVDGFDFDIESVLVTGEPVGDLGNGYSTMINKLRSYFLFETSKTFYISGAPQCIVPDMHLADAIETSYFDFLFVQFYNTPQCSARAYFDHNYGGADTNISFAEWVDFVHKSGLNKKAKVYLGLPASNGANVVYTPEMYLSRAEAKEIIHTFQCEYPDDFGGVMVYEATASETNSVDGNSYVDDLKKDMGKNGCAKQQSTTSSAPITKTPIASSSGLPGLPSGLAPPSTTASNTVLPPGLAPSSSAPYPISSGSAPSSGPTGSSSIIASSGLFPSSSAPYPISSGSAPSSGLTGSSGIIASSGLIHSSGAPYPISSGSAPSSGPTVSSDIIASSGSAPVKTGTAPYTVKTGTAPSGSASFISSGASSGSLPSGSASGVPYPLTNSSSPITTSTGSSPSTTEDEVVSVTEVVTITSCSPGVTNCPAKSHPIVSTEVQISTILPGSSASIPAGGASTASSTPESSPQSSSESGASVPASGAPSSESTPSNSPQSTHDIITTEYLTSYITTCPVTSTVTSSGSQIIETGTTVSTVFSTVTSTICTKCIAPPTPVPTQNSGSTPSNSPQSTHNVITTEYLTSYITTCPVTSTVTSGGSQIIETGTTVSTVYSTITSTIPVPTQKSGSGSPQSQSESPVTGKVTPSASIQEVVTTVIEFTTLTTCPVTNTITSGTSEIVQVTQSVSTITSTITSTICTKCVAPPTGLPVPGSSSSPQGPSVTGAAGNPGSGHQGPALPVPVGSSSPAGSSPAESSSPSNEVESGAQGGNTPSTPAAVGSSGSSPASNTPGSSAESNDSSEKAPVSGSTVPAGNSPASSESQSGAQAGNQPAAPAAQIPAASPTSVSVSGPVTIHSTLNIVPVQTLTIVPIPVSSSQTAKPASHIESGEESNNVPSNGAPSGAAPVGAPATGAPATEAPATGSSGSGSPAGIVAPFPVNNGTVPANPTGTVSPSQGTGSPAQPSVEAFQGAASRMNTGVFGTVAFVVVALLVI